MHATNVCSFATALDEIPARKRGDSRYVLTVLAGNPQFSCFAASEWPRLAWTLDGLKDGGYMIYEPDSKANAYPWCRIQLTDKGRKLIAEKAAREGKA